MDKTFCRVILLLLPMTVAGCKAPALEKLGASLSAPPQPAFGESLTRGYELLAQYEEFNAGNTVSATRFRVKAQQGERAAPDDPALRALPAAEGKEIATARGMLLRTLNALGGSRNGLKMAEAQVNFDCWLERLATAQEAGGLRTAQWCRERFYGALEGLAKAGPKYFAVYFGNSDATPDAAAFAVVRQAAAAWAEHEGDDWHIRLTGRADPAGKADQNLMLSMRRAVAVRNALAQNGVDPGKVSIGATGPRKGGGEHNPERRVDIAVVPPSMDHPEEGEPDIAKMLPQYFGPEGLNF